MKQRESKSTAAFSVGGGEGPSVQQKFDSSIAIFYQVQLQTILAKS